MASKTEKRWAARVEAWRASGQTAPEFAAGKGFAPSTLMYWSSKLKHRRAEMERAMKLRADVEVPLKGEFRETLFEANQRVTLRRIITSVLSGDVFHESSGAAQPHWASFLIKQYPAELPTFA